MHSSFNKSYIIVIVGKPYTIVKDIGIYPRGGTCSKRLRQIAPNNMTFEEES